MLDVQGLQYAYGSRQAVRGVSFRCERAEVYGLLGPNGTGKTTLIGCLAGLRRPSQGSMTFDGASFRPVEEAADRLRLGLVPQELALYEDLTGRENLEFSPLARCSSASTRSATP